MASSATAITDPGQGGDAVKWFPINIFKDPDTSYKRVEGLSYDDFDDISTFIHKEVIHKLVQEDDVLGPKYFGNADDIADDDVADDDVVFVEPADLVTLINKACITFENEGGACLKENGPKMKGNLLDCFKLQYYARRLTSTDPTMIFGPHFNPNMGLQASWYSAHWAAAHMYFGNNWLPRLQSFYAGGQRTFKTQYHVMFVRLVMEAKDLLVWLATQGQKLARGFLQRRRLLQLKDDFTKYQLSVMRELVAAFKPTGTEASKSLLPIELLAIFLNENPAKVAMGP